MNQSQPSFLLVTQELAIPEPTCYKGGQHNSTKPIQDESHPLTVLYPPWLLIDIPHEANSLSKLFLCSEEQTMQMLKTRAHPLRQTSTCKKLIHAFILYSKASRPPPKQSGSFQIECMLEKMNSTVTGGISYELRYLVPYMGLQACQMRTIGSLVLPAKRLSVHFTKRLRV